MSFNEMMLMQQNFSLEDFLFLSSEIQANTVDSFTMSSTVSMNLFNATSLTHEEKDKKCEMVIISLRAILYSLVMIIILLASVIGNTIVIAAILMSSLLRRRTTMHFVTSLGKNFYCFFVLMNFVNECLESKSNYLVITSIHLLK